ncbi:MAG: hypothetical protein ACLP05_04470 [Candidatus Kryptoniota bacterium]
MKRLKLLLIMAFLVGLVSIAYAQDTVSPEDGTYDAQVETDSGTYNVPVEVENGEVTGVHWPNGGDMSVQGAEIEDGEATGTNSRGDSVQIQIDDSEQSDEESSGESED